MVMTFASAGRAIDLRTGSAALLSVNGVSKRFPDGTLTLVDVSVDVHAGEFVSIVGPSGCGKSTLLRLVSGLTPLTSGTVDVDERELGYVFQDATLLPWRTVEGNIELLAELKGVPRAERSQLVKRAIDLVGLDGFERHYPKALSGGMKMRASLARSLTLEPKVFLFDEPFGALDEITRERLNDELQRIFALTGFGGLFITHSIQEACYLSSRVLVMSDRPGRIIGSFDVPMPYPRAPEDRFTAEFARICGLVSSSLRDAHA